MYKPECNLENETQKLLWDFVLQTDHVIPVRKPDLMIVNNNKKENHSDLRVKI